MPVKKKDYVREARFTLITEKILRLKSTGDMILYEELVPFIDGDRPSVYGSRIREYVRSTHNREVRNFRGKGWEIADSTATLKIGDNLRNNATKTLARALRAYAVVSPDELDVNGQRKLNHAIARTYVELSEMRTSNKAIKKLKPTLTALPRPKDS